MGLDIDVDERRRGRERIVQATGAVLTVAVLIAALLGLAGGPGVLSTTTVSDAGGVLQVQFQKFVHHEADDSITVTIAGRAVTSDSVELHLAAAWLAGVDINGVMPQPSEQTQAENAVVLRLPAKPGAAITVGISYRANEYGALDGWVAIPGIRVAYDQFVYP